MNMTTGRKFIKDSALGAGDLTLGLVTELFMEAKRVIHVTAGQKIKTIFLFACFLGLASLNTFSQKKVNKEEWIQLFNGKDLTGWDIKITGHPLNENFKNTFIVDSGSLKANYTEYAQFGTNYGHIYYKEPFSYYKLKVEYRFTGKQVPGGAKSNERNSGVMIHCQPPQTLSVNQFFPVSLEVQLLGGLSDGNPRPTANLCTPGTMIEMDGKLNPEHCINSGSKTYDGDQWVTVEIIVLGDSLIQHKVDGQVVLSYNKPRVAEAGQAKSFLLDKWGAQNEGMFLKEGYIALQAESHPVEFRKVELLKLKGCMNPKCPKYKSYYVVEGDCDCKKKS
jgi:hypothetical protein